MKNIKIVFLILFSSIFIIFFSSKDTFALPKGRNKSEREAVAARLGQDPSWNCPWKCGAFWIAAFDAKEGDHYNDVYNDRGVVDIAHSENSVIDDGNKKILQLKAVGTILGSWSTGSSYSYAKILNDAYAEYKDSSGSSKRLTVQVGSSKVRRDYEINDFGNVYINNPNYYSIVKIDITDIYRDDKNTSPEVSVKMRRKMYDKYGNEESSDIGVETYKIKLLGIPRVKYQTQARSFVKVKQGWRNLRETVGMRNDKPITAKVGETIQFGHKLTNLGDATNDKIASTLIHGNRNYMNVHRLGGGDTISYYQGNGKISRSNKRNNEVFAETGNGVNNQLSGRYLSLDIKPEHAGKTFCSDIVFTKTGARTDNTNPINDNYQFEDPTGIGTYPACVYVPYDNDIQPCMGNGGSNSCGGEPEGEPGTKITGVPKIKNGGGTNTPSNTQWIITKWEVPSNKENIPIPSQTDNEEKDPCRHYRSKFDNSASNCGVVAKSGSGDNSIGANATLTNFGNISAIQNFSVPENAQIGTRFCFAISVSPRTLKDSDTPEKQAQVAGKEWRHSAPLCFKVIKKPKLQIWGGGIFSRKGVRGNNSIYETKGTFSSWGEFEAMAGREGRIINFTSASSNTGTKLNFGNASSGWEELLGRSKDGHISAIAAAYGTATRNDASRRIAVENYNNSTLDGANADTAQRYGDGWTRIIYAKNLFINSNITSRNNIANGVQQTIIVADNIRISNKVDRIDAWLITRGNGVVNTCAQTANNDTISYVNEANCSRQLKINGSILTNRFLPWRTAYSDIKNPDKPSEIINQRADSYLWANRQTGNIGRTVRTTYSKELPIRY